MEDDGLFWTMAQSFSYLIILDIVELIVTSKYFHTKEFKKSTSANQIEFDFLSNTHK